MGDNIYLMLEDILSKYHNEVDSCYNWLRFDDKENEIWLKDEIIEVLEKSGVDYKIDFLELPISCSHIIGVLNVAYYTRGELVLWVKELHQY